MERWTLSAIFPGLKKCWRLQTGKEKKNSIKVKGKHFGCIMRYIFFFIGQKPTHAIVHGLRTPRQEIAFTAENSIPIPNF